MPHPLVTFALSRVRPKRVRGRRLPRMTRRLVALLASRTETPGEKIALGNLREPPALTFPGCTRDRAECGQQLRHALKRLPAMGIVKLPENVAAKFSF